MAVVMTAALCVVPASAADGGISGAIQDFFEWSFDFSNNQSNKFWKAIYGDDWDPNWETDDGDFGGHGVVGGSRDDAIAKLEEHSETLEEETGATAVADDGYLVHYFSYNETAWKVYDTGNTDGYNIAEVGGGWKPYFRFNVAKPSNEYWRLYAQLSRDLTYSFSLPYNAMVRYGFSGVATGAAKITGTSDFGSTAYLRVANTELLPGIVTVEWTYVDITTPDVSARVQVWAEYKPSEGTIDDQTSVDLSADSRPSSIVGDFSALGQDGETVVYSDCVFYDEVTGIYKNPATGAEKVVTDWTYDYPAREYGLTFEDGSHGRVIYGDDHATVYEGDVEYIYNYGNGESGGDSGGDNEGGIGGAIGGLFDVLGEIVYGIIEGALNLATKALDGLSGLLDLFKQLGEMVVDFFGGFTGFLGEVFPFLPEETFTILNFGLILMIAAGVFRKFFK